MEKNKTPMCFFDTPQAWRKWLTKNHLRETEILVGFYRVGSGLPSITWPESVDEALCFGWIDGVRRSVDELSYSIRFTPRKPGSTWSLVNIQKVRDLDLAGKMKKAGMDAFEKRKEKKSGVYSYENKVQVLDSAQEKKFRSDSQAWNYFQLQAPSYRRAAIHWVAQAKQEITRTSRLDTLIQDSREGRRLAHLTYNKK